MHRTWHRSLGTLVWIALVLGPPLVIGLLGSDASRQAGASMWRWLQGADQEVTAFDPTGNLRSGDPIFYQDADDRWRQIGFVQDSKRLKAGNWLQLAWYTEEVSPYACELIQYRNHGRLQDILATMLPRAKRQRIQQRLSRALSQHGEEISEALLPLVEQSLRESLPVIEAEFRASVARHRDEIDRLADRLNRQLLQERLLPLARREVVPIVRKHAGPPLKSIGRELWDRASLWRFGWRALYDRTPLPEQELLQREWDRFVEEEAIPVFEDHLDEIAVAIRGSLADIAENPAIRSELADAASEVARDPEAQRLLRVILRDALVENDRLHAVWKRVWSSEEAQQASELAAQRLDPVVRDIADELFGTRREGIDPNFARVLRNQILGKDRRWIVARAVAERQTELTIVPSEELMLYPIVHLATGDGEAAP